MYQNVNEKVVLQLFYCVLTKDILQLSLHALTLQKPYETFAFVLKSDLVFLEMTPGS